MLVIHKKFVILFIIFFNIFFNQTSAQFSLDGVVKDAHTQEPVAFASVYFAKNTVGKSTDSAGVFSFYFNKFSNDTLIVSFIGYDLFKMPVSELNDNKPIQILLERGGQNNVVVVRNKVNKGLLLWKKIMSRKKQYNRYNLNNFCYEAYNKLEVDIKNFSAKSFDKNALLKPFKKIVKPFTFVFDNIDSTSEDQPFLPAYLVESISDYAYQKSPKKFYENVKASNTKGFKNESISRLTGVMGQNVNIYGNFISIMGMDFVSPFNDNADNFYNFTVADTQRVNGKKIFHFVFRPKHPGQSTFEGDAYVTSTTYQIQKISMYLGKEANINFIDRISIFQEFLPLNDTVIFLNRDKFFADFRVLGKKSLTLIGRKSTNYKNIIINSDSVTNYFKTQKIEEFVKSAEGVNTFSDSAWIAMRHDTLSKNEQAIYHSIDKLLVMPEYNKLKHTLKFIFTGRRDFGNLEIGPWFNWLSADTVEGTRLRFDLATNTGFNKNIYLHGYLAYGFRDKKFKGLAEAYWLLNRKPNLFRLHASYLNDVDNGISQVGEVSQDNIFSLAVRKKGILRKFLQLQDVRFEVLKDFGKGLSGELFLSHRTYKPLLNLPDKFLVNTGNPLTNFEVALKLRWAYLEKFYEGDFFNYSLGTRYPIIELILAQGIPNIGKSTYSYTKGSLTIKDNIKIAPYGSISYKIFGGKVFGTVPFTFLENHPGNDLHYYNGNNYNLMTRFEFISDQYAGINVEHEFGSGIFRFIPITRKLKWRQFWNAKALWGSLNAKNLALNNYTTSLYPFNTLNNKSYIEVGTGVDNILKFLRLDFVWRVSPTKLPGAKTAGFGIFGSFSLQF